MSERKKRIMIDGRNLGLEKGTGVATYARNLSFCLRDLGYDVDVLYGGQAPRGISPLMREISFFDSNVGDMSRWVRWLLQLRREFRNANGYQASRVPLTDIVIKDAFRSRLPHYDRIYNSPDLFAHAHGLYRNLPFLSGRHTVRFRNPPDLAHWTYPLPLRVPRVPNLYTLHDLVPLRLPYTTLDNKRRYLRLVSTIARRADHVVTVSEASKADIVRILKIPAERITNTYQAVSIPDKYANKPEDVVAREVEGTFGLGYKNYFLFWGSIEPKKNIGRIIEGYLSSNVRTPLVLVGAQAWKSEEELKLLYDDNIRTLVQSGEEIRVRKRVIQLSYVPFPLLVSLIRGAKATVFPSLYEGFGLPVLESMLLGTPVISSNTASIPEVAGKAALLVDPYDSRAIGDAIRAFDFDSDLREDYVTRGRAQAALFSEDAYKLRLKELYARFL